MTVNELLADPRYLRLSPTLQSQALRAVALGGSADSILGPGTTLGASLAASTATGPMTVNDPAGAAWLAAHPPTNEKFADATMPALTGAAPVVAAKPSPLAAILAAEPNETVRTPSTGMTPQGWQNYDAAQMRQIDQLTQQAMATGMTWEQARNWAGQEFLRQGQAQHDEIQGEFAPLGINELKPLAGNNGLNAPLAVLLAGSAATGLAGGFSAAPELAAPSAAGATGAGTTGAAASGAPTLAEIAASAAPAGESFVGPATGSVLEPGLQASGAVANSVSAVPTLAELGATELAPLAPVTGLTPLETAAATGGGAVAADKVAGAGNDAPTTGIQDVPPVTIPPLPQADASAIQTAAGGAAGASSAIGRILDGTASNSDWASVLGTGAATGLGVYGANETANKLKEIADRNYSIGIPSRERYEGSFAPNFDINGITGLKGAIDTSTESLLRKASVGGNPYGSPGTMAEILKYVTGNVALPALQQYRNQNAATGGFGAFSTAAPGSAATAANAGGNVYGDIGYGIGAITNPKPQYSLNDILRGLT